jgi:hypothetical protein
MLLPALFFLICKATPHILEQDWVHWHLLPFALWCWLAAHKPRFCVSMSSTISAFQLELCQAPDACNVFTFQVRWVDIEECRRAEAGQDPSQEKVLSDWIRTHSGPDGLMLRTDGTERIGSELSIHESNCSYRFDVQLKNPGQLCIKAWLTYEVRIPNVKYSIALNWKMLIIFQNYVGYSETNSSWLEMQLRPLLANLIKLSSCLSCPT